MRLNIVSQALQLATRISALAQNALYVGRGVLEIAKLEARLASKSLVTICVLSGAVLLLVFSAWCLLLVSAVSWLSSNVLSLTASCLAVCGAMVVLTIPMLLVISRRSKDLSFTATRRQLRSDRVV